MTVTECGDFVVAIHLPINELKLKPRKGDSRFTEHPITVQFVMNKMYHLATCTTCQAIIKDTQVDKKGFDMQDIKTQKITAAQLDEMKKMAGSYEALFSRRAMKYKELGLKEKQLSEKDYRNYILEEYTFLKRPVTIINNKIFIGSEKAAVAALKKEV